MHHSKIVAIDLTFVNNGNIISRRGCTLGGFRQDSVEAGPKRVILPFSSIKFHLMCYEKSCSTLEFGNEDGSAKITVCLMSDDRLYIACGFSNKDINVWETASAVLIGHTKSLKQPTALCLANTHERGLLLVVADRGGEVYAFDYPCLQHKRRLFGHTSSIITAMSITADNKYIITSDRDEKIRVSNFPQTECIASFCLGHTDVVTCVTELGPWPAKETTADDCQYFASCSWDKTVRLWKCDNGEEMDKVCLSGLAEKQEADERTDDCALDPQELLDQEEKYYDINKAGNFPFKLISVPHELLCTGTSESTCGLVAVLLWGVPVVQIFSVVKTSSGMPRFTQPGRSGIADMSINLLSMPCDIKFVRDSISNKVLLLCLLTSPAAISTTEYNIVQAFSLLRQTATAPDNEFWSYEEILVDSLKSSSKLTPSISLMRTLSIECANRGEKNCSSYCRFVFSDAVVFYRHTWPKERFNGRRFS